MKMYECGSSVSARFLGIKCSYKTFVCIADELDNISISEAYEQMVAHLERNGNKTEKVDQFTVKVCSNKYLYIVAHEYVKKCNKYVASPCGIVRHVLNRVWTIDSLYIDETGELIDITHHGVTDCEHNTLSVIGDFYARLNQRPEILLYLIDAMISGRRNISPVITNIIKLDKGLRNIPPIESDNIKLQDYLTNRASDITYMNDQYVGIRNYFEKNCGCKLQMIYNPPPFKIDENFNQTVARKNEDGGDIRIGLPRTTISSGLGSSIYNKPNPYILLDESEFFPNSEFVRHSPPQTPEMVVGSMGSTEDGIKKHINDLEPLQRHARNIRPSSNPGYSWGSASFDSFAKSRKVVISKKK